MRLVAAFQMVQGHAIDGLLEDRVRVGPIHEAWDWSRGLTSVAFLFASGLAFHLASVGGPRFEAHRADPAARKRRFLRALMLIAIGYLLHVPFGALGDGAAWQGALIVDVLQCIGVTLAIIEGLTLLAPRPGIVVAACAALAALAIGAAPFTRSLTPGGPFAFALHYLTETGGSLFPLTPFAGYMLAGVVVGAIASPAGSATPRGNTAATLVGLGVVLMGLAIAGIHLARGPIKLASYDVLELGVVVLGAGLIAVASLRLRSLPRPLRILAGETLVLYVSHLLAVFGAGIGLHHLIGHTLSLPAAIAVALMLVAATAAFGLLWHRGKRAFPGLFTARLAGDGRTG